MQPHQKRAQHRAEHLRHEERYKLRKIAGLDRKPEGHRRVEGRVRTATCYGREYTNDNSKRPAGDDRYPTSALRFGLFEQHVSYHAITQQDKDRGPYEFTKTLFHHLD